MKKLVQKLGYLCLTLLALMTSFTSCFSTIARADDGIEAKAAITMDAQTGQILYQKNADQLRAVASCTKILTLAVIEQDVANGKLKWDQKVRISKHVAKTSTDWHFSNVELKQGHRYTIRALCESMMIVSADGSAEALALADAGSTQAFNKKMEAVAKKAGVTDAKIYNMIGLSNGELGENGLKGVSKKAENAFSAKDMALIARYLVNKYPDALNITKANNVDFKVTDQQSYNMKNINAMLPNNGAAPKNGTMDGLKTGSTDKAGNCFVGTGIFNGRRLITVVLGTDIKDFSKQFTATNKMLEMVQNAYQPVTINRASQFKGVGSKVTVAHGKKKAVQVALKQPVTLWLPKNKRPQAVRGSVVLDQKKRTIGQHKLRAPIKKGSTVGNVQVAPISGMPSVKLPLVAQQTVHKHHLFH